VPEPTVGEAVEVEVAVAVGVLVDVGVAVWMTTGAEVDVAPAG
jgi:hypothetical protein